MALRVLTYVFIVFGFAVALTGCGIKPGSVDPPPGAEDRVFPRTYPDIATDPAP